MKKLIKVSKYFKEHTQGMKLLNRTYKNSCELKIGNRKVIVEEDDQDTISLTFVVLDCKTARRCETIHKHGVDATFILLTRTSAEALMICLQEIIDKE